MEIYPIQCRPIFKERLWGGQKLREVLHKGVQGTAIGESWELSGVPGSASEVINGVYAGKTLAELLDTNPVSLLGGAVHERFGTEFPVLIKFIDARLDLSIQLHPDDELARKRHNSFGKTEMWYILDAEPGARLIVGFKRDVSPEEYQEALDTGTLTDLLHYQDVRPGEAYFIPSGKIHAIGGGILLAEIQQTSDVTYRVYDFDRRDADGNLRELHTEWALEAMDFKSKDDFKLPYTREANRPNPLISCPYFTTDYLRLDQDFDKDLSSRESFTILIGLSGTATVHCGSGHANIGKGETLLLPAAATGMHIRTTGCELLEVSL